MQYADCAMAELEELQKKYKDVLVKAKDSITQSRSSAAVDEIGVFWFENKKFVEFILAQYFAPYSTYVFTAVTMMDINDNEHYPFSVLGLHHVYDDPLYKYINIANQIENPKFDEELQQHISNAIEDNIRIIDSCSGIISVLPVRYFANQSSDLAYRAAKQAFFSMFSDKTDQKTYKDNYITIEDVVAGLAPHAKDTIIFDTYDEENLDLQSRFLKYKQNTVLPISKDMNDAQIFQFAMQGYFYQAFETLLMCAENRLIPYIRFDAAFHYMHMLSGNLGNSPESLDMIYKGIVAHVHHNIFDKERFTKLKFREYHTVMQESNYDARLFESLEKQGVNKRTPSVKAIAETSEAILESILLKYKI
ncbi:hypothetical protein Psch_02621 [Pelotomaculum schinkii]|uniref:Uncharacterized protein n=1 Tax=Pelotomaculum schinkii TaxID=78350 RepID=A0A4Y7RAA1_9FIRM|nr:hypothetical protein [Pelotomaculum schinkii]TEB05580.1 hypothetical protein Psch_02621 [Pelotomaculum schinkii]